MWKIAKSRLGNLAQNRGKSRSPSWLPGPWVPWVVKYSKILNQGILNDECINPMKGIIRSKTNNFFPRFQYQESHLLGLFRHYLKRVVNKTSMRCPARDVVKKHLWFWKFFSVFFQKTYPSRKVNCIFFVVIAYDLRSQFLLYSPLSGKEPRLERFFFFVFLVFHVVTCFQNAQAKNIQFHRKRNLQYYDLSARCILSHVLGEFVG